MTSTARTRPVHRALSVVFMVLVLANVIGLVFGWQAQWLWGLTLVPLFGLMASGTWLYVAPHLRKRP